MCGLLTSEGQPAFLNATVCLSSVEANFWRNPANETDVIDDAKPCFALAREMLAPYEEKGHLRLLDTEETGILGIQAVNTAGHTPGHTAFLFTSEGEQLLLWGDLVHSAGIQFKYPFLYTFFDANGPKAVESRLRIFDLAADRHILIGGAHVPAPGFGHVVHSGNAYQWVSM